MTTEGKTYAELVIMLVETIVELNFVAQDLTLIDLEDKEALDILQKKGESLKFKRKAIIGSLYIKENEEYNEYKSKTENLSTGS